LPASDAMRAALAVVLAVVLAAAVSGCATVPVEQQAFLPGTDGGVTSKVLACPGADGAAAGPASARLLSPTLRVVSWNLHKNGEPGWERDLARFAADSDLLLIQEAALTDRLRRVLADAGYDWLLAGAFRFAGHEMGVLTAARAAPAGGCTQRFVEPLLQLPKATAITRYRVEGVDGTLAVANVHSINFTLTLGNYRAQLEAMAKELAGHRGPVIVAGDLNTWNGARLHVVDEVMRSIGLAPVLPVDDTRSRFLGRQVDYIFVRGLDAIDAASPSVRSSDHNPLLATLRVKAAPAP
jgi:endonuclease/exonuclease/phosphatase (EEP) superfamily protein YafD